MRQTKIFSIIVGLFEKEKYTIQKEIENIRWLYLKIKLQKFQKFILQIKPGKKIKLCHSFNYIRSTNVM